MPCYHPLRAWRRPGVGGAVTFSDDGSGTPLKLPCGRCVGCQLERSRQWAVRCMHEASLHEANCFITLTYDESNLPGFGSLVKEDFRGFMKRLRRRHDDIRIKFFAAGEYGKRGGRPHYHSCLFNFDFADKTPWTVRKGFQVWRSRELESLWPQGQSEIGSLTFESAAYVARYLVKSPRWKEVVDNETGEIVPRVHEYAVMSRRPGLAAGWHDRYGREVADGDSVVVRGRECKPPRFYDKRLQLSDPLLYEEVKLERELGRRRDDETPERLAVREVVCRSKLNTFCQEEL